jgi:hypothetical protein
MHFAFVMWDGCREVSDFEQTQFQPRAQCFQNPERLGCPNEHHFTATRGD